MIADTGLGILAILVAPLMLHVESTYSFALFVAVSAFWIVLAIFRARRPHRSRRIDISAWTADVERRAAEHMREADRFGANLRRANELLESELHEHDAVARARPRAPSRFHPHSN